MSIKLTPSQIAFAKGILDALKNNHTAVLTAPRSGKSVLFHNLEEYLRLPSKTYDIEDFVKFVDRSGTTPLPRKHFRPKIVGNDGHYLSQDYGITEVRRLAICAAIEEINEEMKMKVTRMAHRIDRLADICNNLEEFIFAVHLDAIYLEKTGQTLP